MTERVATKVRVERIYSSADRALTSLSRMPGNYGHRLDDSRAMLSNFKAALMEETFGDCRHPGETVQEKLTFVLRKSVAPKEMDIALNFIAMESKESDREVHAVVLEVAQNMGIPLDPEALLR